MKEKERKPMIKFIDRCRPRSNRPNFGRRCWTTTTTPTDDPLLDIRHIPQSQATTRNYSRRTRSRRMDTQRQTSVHTADMAESGSCHGHSLEEQQQGHPPAGNDSGNYRTWARGRGGHPGAQGSYSVQVEQSFTGSRGGYYGRGWGRETRTHTRWNDEGAHVSSAQFRQQAPWRGSSSGPPPPYMGNNAQFVRNPLARPQHPRHPSAVAPSGNTYFGGGGNIGQENWRRVPFTPSGLHTPGALIPNQFHFQDFGGQSTFHASQFHNQNMGHGFFHQQYFQPQGLPFSNNSGLLELRDWENRGGWNNNRNFSFRNHSRRLSLDLYPRKWEQVKSSDGDGSGAEIPISVMCYNILAPTLLREHQYLYKQCDPAALDWSYRKYCFYKEIETYAPDVVCLQEVEANLLEEYDSFFQEQGYSGVFKKRTGDKCDGCAIYYRDNKFNLVDSISVEYFQKPAVPLLDRDNIGLLVKLQTKSGIGQQGHTFVVATTHLLFNQRRNDIKIGQAMLLLAELDRLSCYGVDEMGTPNYYPTIVTGDFNVNPNHTISQLLSEGSITVDTEFLSANDKYKSIPSKLGISLQCQHSELQNRRKEQFRTDSELGCEFHSRDTETYVNLRTSRHHFNSKDGSQDLGRISSRKPQVEPESGSENESETPVNSKLSHAFNFQDVYGFSTENSTENKENFVTTQHKKWVRVDFMYYSTKPQTNQQSRREEANLKLLRRLKLPTISECKSRIPCEGNSSDHFPLLAEFMLKT